MTRCSTASRARGDELDATAPPGHRWLLLELPGPWGPAGILDCRLPRPIGRAVQARAAAEGLRVLLIRRFGRPAAASTPHAWAVVDGHRGTTTWSTWADADWLVEGPLPGAVANTDRTDDGVTYLVCAHSRHDACCAVRGRPVAKALAELRPTATWECSHVGGDRFAANVVVLPWGLYYGRVEVDDVPALVEHTESGRVLVDHFRGRSGVEQPAQAAQQYLRRRRGDDRRDAFGSARVMGVGDDTWQVTITGQAPLRVTRSAVNVEAGLTCAAIGPAHAWNWSVEPVIPPA